MTDPIDIRSRLPRTGPHSVSRIDTLGLESPVRIVPGSFEQRQCAPGVCQGLPTCSDEHCEGHPGTASRPVRPPDEPSPLERVPDKAASLPGWVVALLVFCLLALAVAVFGPPHDH